MPQNPRRDKKWLLAVAKQVATELKPRIEGTRLRVRIPSRATDTGTDGWAATIGDLGKNQPQLAIWFDRFSGYDDRKLYACFCSDEATAIDAITKCVSDRLWPVREIGSTDLEEGKHLVLSQRLARSEFNSPILEKYANGETFYGIYDVTRPSAERISPHFCNRAVAFFEDVIHELPNAKAVDEQREVYARCENRSLVASHLRRERSRLLATDCKIRDEYTCQVCGMDFESDYGPIGKDFAESHHLVPLGQLEDEVQTRVEDLITVCSNCHRMLHRMPGTSDDVKKLRLIYRQRHEK